MMLSPAAIPRLRGCEAELHDELAPIAQASTYSLVEEFPELAIASTLPGDCGLHALQSTAHDIPIPVHPLNNPLVSNVYTLLPQYCNTDTWGTTRKSSRKQARSTKHKSQRLPAL